MSDEQRVVTLDVGPLRRPFHEQLHGQGLKKARSTPLLEQAADAIYLLLTACLLSPEAGGLAREKLARRVLYVNRLEHPELRSAHLRVSGGDPPAEKEPNVSIE